ncbi:PLAC8-domain-containing protein [Lactarius akahatsu]|uniref:PLAC8-domain-containing protein n=1 Tax=Lactarius akahatsu TaxID=416441 RepID=A0AAD4Q3C0_9AGAM|nr:PLAC8-domain-containing protein [Lactarius akahatsu]
MPIDTKETVSSQPQATTPMATGGNRNALNREVGVDGQRDWSFDLFDCTSACGLCCLAAWCPCVVYSKNKQRLQHLQTRGTPLPSGGERYDGNCCIYGSLLITRFAWILQIGTRADIRGRYNIRGDTVGDCLTSWCCHSCSLTQERREIELEENSFEGFSQST